MKIVRAWLQMKIASYHPLLAPPLTSYLQIQTPEGKKNHCLPLAKKRQLPNQYPRANLSGLQTSRVSVYLITHPHRPPMKCEIIGTPLQLVLGVGGEGGCFPMPSRPHLTVKEAQHNLYQPSSILLLFSVLLCIFDHPTCFTLLSLILDLDFSRPFLSY